VPVHFNFLASNAFLVSQLSTQIPIKKRSFSSSINPRRTGPGRGRGSDKGPITVTWGISERQKKPSVTLSFNGLLPASVLPRQHSPSTGTGSLTKSGAAKASLRNFTRNHCLVRGLQLRPSDIQIRFQRARPDSSKTDLRHRRFDV
jgi:hypothetical protein